MAILSNNSNRSLFDTFSLDPNESWRFKQLDAAFNALRAAFAPLISCCSQSEAFANRDVVARMEKVLEQLIEKTTAIKSKAHELHLADSKLASDTNKLEASSRLLLSRIRLERSNLPIGDDSLASSTKIRTPEIGTRASGQRDATSLIGELRASADLLKYSTTHHIVPDDVPALNPANFTPVADSLSDRLTVRMSQHRTSDAAMLARVETRVETIKPFLTIDPFQKKKRNP